MDAVNTEKTIKRIKHLLALAGGSANMHEASSALKMAKDLMKAHSITKQDLKDKLEPRMKTVDEIMAEIGRQHDVARMLREKGEINEDLSDNLSRVVLINEAVDKAGALLWVLGGTE